MPAPTSNNTRPNGNEEWGDFPQTDGFGNARINTFETKTPDLTAIFANYQANRSGRTAQANVNNGAVNNGLPGVFGTYQRPTNTAPNATISVMTRSSTEMFGSRQQTGNRVTAPARRTSNNWNSVVQSMGLKVKRNEVDTKTMSANDLEDLKKTDPFLYHSIPAVSSSSRFFGDVNLQEVQRPTQGTLMRSMMSCPGRMAQSAQRAADQDNTKVQRRTRISHEVHILRFEEMDSSDEEDED